LHTPPYLCPFFAQLKYVVMIDAGSSGSRVHVYSYRDAAPLPEFELPSKTLKLKPGLSSYEHAPAAGGASLLGLLEFARKHVRPADMAQTPVYLYAYAAQS
jgi:Golgi nucleoside diphosphatase